MTSTFQVGTYHRNGLNETWVITDLPSPYPGYPVAAQKVLKKTKKNKTLEPIVRFFTDRGELLRGVACTVVLNLVGGLGEEETGDE